MAVLDAAFACHPWSRPVTLRRISATTSLDALHPEASGHDGAAGAVRADDPRRRPVAMTEMQLLFAPTSISKTLP
jgi:hypothetical protein